MGSAITFTDKITNKNCQNLEDLKEPLCSSNSSGSSSGSCNRRNHCFHHVNHHQKTKNQKEYGEKDKRKLKHEVPGNDHEDEEYYCASKREEQKAARGKPETLFTRLGNRIMGRRCLCDTIKPILKLSQLLGVIPLRLVHRRNVEGEIIGSCELTCRWKSSATLLNTCFITFFILISPFAHSEIRDRMSNVFTGTDLYAFTLQMMAMVLETTILLTIGRLYNGKFSKGWSSLNEVFHAICDSPDDLKQIKLGSYITALIIMVEGVGFFLFMYWTSHRAIGVYQSCSALLIGTFVISLTLIIPYIMSTLFLFICLLIRSHFLKISDMLRTVVSKQNSPKLSSKIDSLRVLHEQLCQTVTYFEDFFGFQVLLTLCTCCFTVTVGAYACILQGEGMSSPQGKELTGAWAMQLYCAMIFILLILISGQLVTNAAASPGPVLNALPLSDLDERSQIQAATNITTYLLVLMQFKLSFENRFGDDDAENFTIPLAGFEMDSSTEPIFYNVTVPESLAFLTESL